MSLSISVTSKLIVQFEKATGLTFISDDTPEGNVCFADNHELRAEFKSTFRKSDVENYFLGLSQIRQNNDLAIPQDAETFWDLADLGKELNLKSK